MVVRPEPSGFVGVHDSGVPPLELTEISTLPNSRQVTLKLTSLVSPP
jgi:hypothetical protein